MSITGKVDAMVGGLRRENNALRKNYEKERTRATVLESRILHAFLAAVHAELPCPFCGAETGHVSPFARHIGDCVVETIELAAAPPPSVGGDDGGHIGAMPGYDPLTRSVNEPRPNTTRGLCPECLDDSGLDSLHKYGVMTEHLAQLAAALGLREGKHTADSVARIAIERLVLAPRSETAEPNADLASAALEVAIALAEEGWGYASPYFRQKWDCEGRAQALRKIAGVSPTEPLPTDWAEQLVDDWLETASPETGSEDR